MKIGYRAGIGDTRIGYNDLYTWVNSFMGFHPSPQDRVAPGRIGPGYKKAIGLFDIFIAGRHAVFSQGHFIGGDGATHAKPGVGVDIIAADKPFYQFIDHVIFFREALPGYVKGYRIGAVFITEGPEYGGRSFQCSFQTNTLPGHFFILAHLRVQTTIVSYLEPLDEVYA